jgi:hypothetical protein
MGKRAGERSGKDSLVAIPLREQCHHHPSEHQENERQGRCFDPALLISGTTRCQSDLGESHYGIA